MKSPVEFRRAFSFGTARSRLRAQEKKETTTEANATQQAKPVD